MTRFVIETAQPTSRFVIEPAEAPRRSRFEQLDALVRGAADMATFGFADEIAAAGDTYLNPLNDKSYSENLAAQRGRDDLDAETLPVTRFAGQAVGAVPAMMIPGMGAANVARAAQAGQGVLRAGASVGARQGALYGAGSADPTGGQTIEGMIAGDPPSPPGFLDAVGQRAAGAVMGGATGAVGGAVLGKAGQMVGRGADSVRRFVYENASPRRAAETALNRELQASGTSAQQLLDEVLPAHKSLTPQQRTRAFEILGEEMRNPRGAIGRAEARMAQEFGTTPSASTKQLRSMRQRWEQTYGGPLTVSELPSVVRANAAMKGKKAGDISDEQLTAWDDTATRQLVDTLANSGGRAATRVTNVLQARQGGTRGRLQGALLDTVGGQDFATVAQQLDDQLTQAGRAAYRQAYAVEQPVAPALQQVMQRTTRRIGARTGVVQEALLRARNEFYRELQVQGQPPVRQVVTSLQQAIDARGVLNDMIGAAVRAGDNQVARALTQMHREVTVALRRTNPEWWNANQIWGDARNGQRAMELGEQLLMRSGPALREALQVFDRMPPAMQERFRVAAAQRLHDMLNNATDTVDLARLFRNQSVRNTLRHVFGPEAATRLIRRIRDETLATSTNRLTGNSRTALRLEARERLNEGTDVAGAARMLSPSGISDALMGRLSRFLADRRNVPLADMAMTPLDRPDQVIPLLQRLAAQRSRAPVPRAPRRAAQGAAAGAFLNNTLQDRSF